MKRYSVPPYLKVEENPDGEFVKILDVMEAFECAINFAHSHRNDINAQVDDFGELKPILEFINQVSS